MATSRVTWNQTAAPAIGELTSAVTKLEWRRQIAEQMQVSYETLSLNWGETPSVERGLFHADTAGNICSRYPFDIGKWKTIVRGYAAWYRMSSIDDLTTLWLDIIDTLLRCQEFEVEATDAFRSWVFGTAVQFCLRHRADKRKAQQQQQKKRKIDSEYDPEHPGY